MHWLVDWFWWLMLERVDRCLLWSYQRGMEWPSFARSWAACRWMLRISRWADRRVCRAVGKIRAAMLLGARLQVPWLLRRRLWLLTRMVIYEKESRVASSKLEKNISLLRWNKHASCTIWWVYHYRPVLDPDRRLCWNLACLGRLLLDLQLFVAGLHRRGNTGLAGPKPTWPGCTGRRMLGAYQGIEREMYESMGNLWGLVHVQLRAQDWRELWCSLRLCRGVEYFAEARSSQLVSHPCNQEEIGEEIWSHQKECSLACPQVKQLAYENSSRVCYDASDFRQRKKATFKFRCRNGNRCSSGRCTWTRCTPGSEKIQLKQEKFVRWVHQSLSNRQRMCWNTKQKNMTSFDKKTLSYQKRRIHLCFSLNLSEIASYP